MTDMYFHFCKNLFSQCWKKVPPHDNILFRFVNQILNVQIFFHINLNNFLGLQMGL